MMLKSLLASLTLVTATACGGAPHTPPPAPPAAAADAPSCIAVGDRYDPRARDKAASGTDLFARTKATDDAMRAGAVQACRNDGWSDALISCYADGHDVTAWKRCDDMLSRAQRDGLGKHLLASMQPRIDAAAPPSVRVTKQQFEAAQKAVRAKLKVDPDRYAACQKQVPPDPSTADAPTLTALGVCFHDAGSLGFALRYWSQVVRDHPGAKEAEEAARRLGPTSDEAADWIEAPEKYEAFAETYGYALDARDQLVRAICLREQLGDDENVKKDLYLLARLSRNTPFDPDHLCDTIRPIELPAP